MTPLTRPARRRSRLRAEPGQAAVEMVVALPLVAVGLLLVVQAALVVRDQIVVVHAAREAARAVAVDSSPRAARDGALASAPLDDDRLSVIVAGPRRVGEPQTVIVSYSSPTDIPLVGALVGDVRVTAKASMRIER